MAKKSDDVDLVKVKQEIQAFVSRQPMQVTDKQSSISAQEAVVAVRKEQKTRKAWFTENILSHAKKAHEQAKASYDAQKAVLVDLLKPFVEWEKQTSQNIVSFESKERERLRKEQEKENEKFRKRAEAALVKGKDLESVKPSRVMVSPAKTTKSSAGGFTLRNEKELVVFNESLLPEKYWIKSRNDMLIKQDLRAGVEVPGALLQDALSSSVRTA